MSQKISENMTEALNSAFGSNVSSISNDRKQSQVYLNIGMPIKGADGETVFASLPFGIPIDTQDPKTMTTSPKLNHFSKKLMSYLLVKLYLLIFSWNFGSVRALM